MQVGHEGRFVRIPADHRLTISVCTQCHDVIALSPNPNVLVVAEKAHKCDEPRIVKRGRTARSRLTGLP